MWVELEYALVGHRFGPLESLVWAARIVEVRAARRCYHRRIRSSSQNLTFSALRVTVIGNEARNPDSIRAALAVGPLHLWPCVSRTPYQQPLSRVRGRGG